jgi:CheY-like chemotaxis protein
MDGFEASRQIREMYGVPLNSSTKKVHTKGSDSCQSCKESQERVSKSTAATTTITTPKPYTPDTLPRIRIVAITANASYAHRQRVLQSGIDYCILKPVRLDDLHEVVRQLAAERNFAFKNII